MCDPAVKANSCTPCKLTNFSSTRLCVSAVNAYYTVCWAVVFHADLYDEFCYLFSSSIVPVCYIVTFICILAAGAINWTAVLVTDWFYCHKCVVKSPDVLKLCITLPHVPSTR